METIILAWYVLQTTNSAFLTALIAALRFAGTLLAPGVGVLADRVSRRRLVIAIRIGYLLLAALLSLATINDFAPLLWVFVVATLAGLLRPSEMIVRQSLIADTVPKSLLANAIGFSRTTMESARVVGALTGAALLSTLGLSKAYIVITVFYLFAVLLSVGITGSNRHSVSETNRVLVDLLAGLKHVVQSPSLSQAMMLAFTANLTAFPVTMGLLPVIARNHLGSDEHGLAIMTATVAMGSLLGALLVALVQRERSPQRIMIAGLIVWHLLIVVFAALTTVPQVLVCLLLIGLAAAFAMVPMAVTIMATCEPAFRGRVMGVRMLAVYGLPLGLLIGGVLIELIGITRTVLSMGIVGLVPVLAVARRLWH